MVDRLGNYFYPASGPVIADCHSHLHPADVVFASRDSESDAATLRGRRPRRRSWWG